MKITRNGQPITLGELDAEGQSLVFRAADLKAQWMLIDMAEWEFNAGNKAGSCQLIHAQAYLRDRLAYELAPWPKNCIPNPDLPGPEDWREELEARR